MFGNASENEGPIGREIVVFSPKGGVGKSVVTSNLGVALISQLKAKVCLVDLDVSGSGDLSRMLGLTPKKCVDQILPDLERFTPETATMAPIEELITVHATGVHVVQCLSHPKNGSKVDKNSLKVLFRALKARYDYIIVDSKVISDQLITACNESNLILMVTTPDVVSLYQVRWGLNVIESFLLPPELVKAVLNRAGSRGSVESQDAKMAITCETIAEIPSDGRAMGDAINTGTPVVSMYGNTKIAESFKRFADYLGKHPEVFLTQKDLPAEGEGAKELVRDSDDAAGDSNTQSVSAMKFRIHKQLIKELDLRKVDLDVLNDPKRLAEMREKTEQVVARLLSREIGGMIASTDMRDALVKEITDEAVGLGPLEELIDDVNVTDILVNDKDHIYVERFGKLERSHLRFLSDDQVRSVIERIVAPLGRRIDESTPMVDARLADGSRVNAIIPPLALKGSSLSIRKFARKMFTWHDLVEKDSITEPIVRFIEACVSVRKNIIVSGGTGSGKTTMLNIVSSFIPDDERIITLEDAAELRLGQEHWVSLESRPPNVEGKGQITIRDLFRNTLRMRPDRIVVGECRGGETLDMLQAMNTGHDGSLTTIHANSPRDVIARLDSMVMMSNLGLPMEAIREMVASAVDLIVHTARLSDGKRKLISVSEISGLDRESHEIKFKEIFKFQQIGLGKNSEVIGYFTPTGEIPDCLEEMKIKGIRAVKREMFQPIEPPQELIDQIAYDVVEEVVSPDVAEKAPPPSQDDRPAQP